jgi:5'-3' exonuclease
MTNALVVVDLFLDHCFREEWKGGVAAVVTEDSDLIIYGCKRILFKLDSNGMGQEFLLDSLIAAPPPEVIGDIAKGTVVSFRGFDLLMLRTLGVLAGCDFLPSVPGMGFKTAHALVKKYRSLSRVRPATLTHHYTHSSTCFAHTSLSNPPLLRLPQVLTIMKYEKGMKLEAGYQEAAQRALQVCVCVCVCVRILGFSNPSRIKSEMAPKSHPSCNHPLSCLHRL